MCHMSPRPKVNRCNDSMSCALDRWAGMRHCSVLRWNLSYRAAFARWIAARTRYCIWKTSTLHMHLLASWTSKWARGLSKSDRPMATHTHGHSHRTSSDAAHPIVVRNMTQLRKCVFGFTCRTFQESEADNPKRRTDLRDKMLDMPNGRAALTDDEMTQVCSSDSTGALHAPLCQGCSDWRGTVFHRVSLNFDTCNFVRACRRQQHVDGGSKASISRPGSIQVRTRKRADL